MALSLRSRLVLLVGLAAAVPLVALAFFWSRDLQDRARAELGQEQPNLAEVVRDQVGAMVEEMQRRGSGAGEGVLTEDGVRRIYGYPQVAGPSWVLAIGAPASLAGA